MSERDEFELTREEKRASEAIRALPRADADPDFRQRLKADFAAGRLAEGGDATAPRPARRPAARWWKVAIPVAAAVLVVAAALFNRGPALVLSDVAGEGTVTVDGRAFPTSDRDAIAGAVRPGARLELSEGVDVDLVYDNTLVLQYSSARGTIPKAPARWIGKTGACRLEWGEVAALTGPDFAGGGLVVTTPEGIIEVSGTLISVFRDSSVTCVCVHEGAARVGIDEGDMESVPAGKRKVMFADGKTPIITDIAPPHMDHLIEFDNKYRSGIHPVD